MPDNPWLSIPLDDYEGHMSLPAVGQARMIAQQLDRALARWTPASIAVIGCSGGNGLETVTASTVERVVAVDVNPRYIERARARHSHRLPRLELICADVQSDSLTYEPVDLTYAALLFEYVDVPSALKTVRRNSRPGAILTTVLQLPHSTLEAITPSPYPSLGRLASLMTPVAPETLARIAAEMGFAADHSSSVELPSGKTFCVQTFKLQ